MIVMIVFDELHRQPSSYWDSKPVGHGVLTGDSLPDDAQHEQAVRAFLASLPPETVSTVELKYAVLSDGQLAAHRDREQPLPSADVLDALMRRETVPLKGRSRELRLRPTPHA